MRPGRAREGDSGARDKNSFASTGLSAAHVSDHTRFVLGYVAEVGPLLDRQAMRKPSGGSRPGCRWSATDSVGSISAWAAFSGEVGPVPIQEHRCSLNVGLLPSACCQNPL